MIDNMCHRKRNDYKIDMAIDTFWHESIVHKIGKVLLKEKWDKSRVQNWTTVKNELLQLPLTKDRMEKLVFRS